MKLTLEKVKEMQAQLKDTVGERPQAQLKDTVGERPAEATKTRVLVGVATCGLASGAGKVMTALQNECKALGLSDIEVVPTGCIGLCQYEPLVEVLAPGQPKVTYIKMTVDKVKEVVKKHLQDGHALGKYTMTYADEEAPNNDDAPITSLDDTPFYKKQVRIALHNCGIINPENIDEYIARGGYQGLGKALLEMSPDAVIQSGSLHPVIAAMWKSMSAAMRMKVTPAHLWTAVFWKAIPMRFWKQWRLQVMQSAQIRAISMSVRSILWQLRI